MVMTFFRGLPTRRIAKANVERLSGLTDCIADRTLSLERAILAVQETVESANEAFTIRDVVLPRMAELRCVCDEAETVTAHDFWPFPTYGELLFSVR